MLNRRNWDDIRCTRDRMCGTVDPLPRLARPEPKRPAEFVTALAALDGELVAAVATAGSWDRTREDIAAL